MKILEWVAIVVVSWYSARATVIISILALSWFNEKLNREFK